MAAEPRLPPRGGVRSHSCPALRACLLALVVASCAGTTAPAALDDAHAAVERARSAPRVRALAPAELDLAETALEQAGAAARAGAPRAEVEHLAYVASQRAAFAEARAAAQVARSETRLLRRALGQVASEARVADQPTRRLRREARRPPPTPEPGPSQRASVEADQGTPAAAPETAVADVETLPEEITLDLAKLPFEQAELTAEAVVELARLADRLLGEPWRRLRIEAEFGLPDLGVRTLTERRVEVVRAFFRARGVAPARLVVHATGDGPLPPPTTSLAAPAQ